MTVAKLSNFGFTYAGAQTPALLDIDLTVRRGDSILLTGPSGGGKSTLALCLAGLTESSVPGRITGSLSLFGHELAAIPQGHLVHRVAVLFQDPDTQLFMSTPRRELRAATASLPQGVSGASVEAAIDLFGLRQVLDAETRHLSGGWRQRVALACAIALQPELLVLDEPLAQLDGLAGRELVALLFRLRAERPDMALVMVEHRLDDLAELFTGAAFIQGGRLACFASLAELFTMKGAAGPSDEPAVWTPEAFKCIELARRRHPGCALPVALTAEGAARSLRESGLTFRPGPEPQASAAPQVRPRIPLVTLSGAAFGYAGAAPVLRQLDLEIRTGEAVGIVGRNGSGKTTLGKALVGLLAPRSGSAQWEGRPAQGRLLAIAGPKLHYVYQSAESNFLMPTVQSEAAATGACSDDIAAALAHYGLSHATSVDPLDLSQGEKRRLSLACARLRNVQLVVLDEPSIGLDQRSFQQLADDIVALKTAGAAVVVISHDSQLLARAVDRIVALSAGTVLADTSLRAFFADGRLCGAVALSTPVAVRIGEALEAEHCTDGTRRALTPEALADGLVAGPETPR